MSEEEKSIDELLRERGFLHRRDTRTETDGTHQVWDAAFGTITLKMTAGKAAETLCSMKRLDQ